MSITLKGLYTALITPFDEAGNVDVDGLRILLRAQIAAHVDGIVILGTTGEAPTLTEKEREKIVEIGVDEAKGKAQIIVGTGTYSTAQTILETKKAKSMGADAALIITPYYNKPTQQGLFLHFKAISEAIDLPLCVYNCQSRTGVNLHTGTLAKLACLPGIVGVKEASVQVSQMSEVLERIPAVRPDFAVLSGDDGLALPLFALGGHGLISVASNLIPETMKKFVDASLSGDLETARQYHYRLSPLFRALFVETNPMPIKAALKWAKKPSGNCRLPLTTLQTENMAHLKAILEQL